MFKKVYEGNFKFPLNFSLLDKEKYEYVIKYLSSQDSCINIQNIMSSKIFFINWQNNLEKREENNLNSNNLYMGVLDNNNDCIIYFYSINEDKYIFEFLIVFNENKSIYEEFTKYIKPLGIGKYLSEMGINFSNKELIENLINKDLKKLGFFINFFPKNINNVWTPTYPKNIEYKESSDFLIWILNCLLNIEPLKNFFLDRNELSKIINNNTIYTKLFYEIFQYLWYWNNDKQNNLYDLRKQILKESDSNIFEDIKSLIEFLLLKLDIEQKNNNLSQTIENEPFKLEKIYINIEDIENILNSSKNSIIQKNFFFEFVTNYDHQCNEKFQEQYCIKCTLEFDINKIANILEKERPINIYDILNNLIKDNICQSENLINHFEKLKTFPKFLIIIIKQKENNNFSFNLEEFINIAKYLYDKGLECFSNYELISFIKNKSETICKSPVNNNWYIYKDNKIEKQENLFNNPFENIPYLLIYKNKNIVTNKISYNKILIK